MKKTVFSLALFLMSLGTAVAQSWNFADRDPFISEADVALINADATNWYNDAKVSLFLVLLSKKIVFHHANV
jgi:hypothetical protein